MRCIQYKTLQVVQGCSKAGPQAVPTIKHEGGGPAIYEFAGSALSHSPLFNVDELDQGRRAAPRHLHGRKDGRARQRHLPVLCRVVPSHRMAKVREPRNVCELDVWTYGRRGWAEDSAIDVRVIRFMDLGAVKI